MQITHEEARDLIQFNMDRMLKPQEIDTLQTHLSDCVECSNFAEEIKEVVNLLTPIMKNQWDLHPAPLSISALAGKGKSQLSSSLIMTTRIAIIGMALAAFVFSAWQFALSGHQTSTPMPVGALPVPTPSGQSTSTKIRFQDCKEIIYQVQENDTLESIASQFSASKDKIMAINSMSSETINTNMELLIPICNSTPTGTVHPSTLTTTFTPLVDPNTSTPGG